MKNKIFTIISILCILITVGILFFILNGFLIELKEMHKSIVDIYTLLHKSWLF
jgi:uncharacterized protein YneF (UPF0154 family)